MFDTKLSKLLLQIDKDTLVISDTHFNHDGVLKFEPCRLKAMHNDGMSLYTKGEESLLNIAHTEWIIKNWNEKVKPDDIIIHLGDVAWKGHQEIIPRLNGIKILILGNHDKKGPNTYHQFDHVVRGYYNIKDGKVSIVRSTDPLMSCIQLQFGLDRILLSHYPATTKEHRYRKEGDKIIWQTPINDRIDALIEICKDESINLNIHGHTHSLSYNKTSGKRFKNVSMEAINFRPCTLKECLDDN